MTPEDPYRPQDLSTNPYAAPLAEAEHPLNPWVGIWTQPRATVRQIVDTNPRYMVLPIVIMLGVATGLSGASDAATDPDMQKITGDSLAAVAGALIAGIIFMPLFWLLNSWLISITAGWIGGQATLTETRAAYAWGSVPGLFGAPLSLLVLILLPQQGLARLQGLIAISNVVEGVLGIWTFVALCKCIGEVNRFSAWKGWGAMILAGLLLMVPLMVIVFVGVAVVIAVSQ